MRNVTLSDLREKAKAWSGHVNADVNIAIFLRTILFASRQAGVQDSDVESALSIFEKNHELEDGQLEEFVRLYTQAARQVPKDLYGFRSVVDVMPEDYLRFVKENPQGVYSMAYILKCVIELVEDENNDIQLSEDELDLIEEVKVEGFPEEVDEFIEVADQYIENIARLRSF